MSETMSDLRFKGMASLFYLRDRIRPRDSVLAEVGIEEGYSVLDYGCGPGSYAILAAKAVGDSGKVYALDIHPLASQMVEAKASRDHLANIETITSDCATGLPTGSIDAVFLYDIFHMLDNRNEVLRELRRVLKPEGILSFSDHHMKEENIRSGVTADGIFEFVAKGKLTYTFRPAG